MDGWNWAAVAAVFVAAGAVKGVSGMGLPTVAVSLLGLWMTPLHAAALLVVPSLATNVAQCRGPHLGRLVRMLWPAWAGLTLATVLTPSWPADAIGFDARVPLGAVLMLYGLWGLWRPALPQVNASPAMQALIGAATGVVTSATAVFALPLVPYLQALRLDKDALVQALGLSFTVATVALAVRLQGIGTGIALSLDTLAALAGAFAGLGLGAQVRARISAVAFQRGLFAVFIVLGLANLARGF